MYPCERLFVVRLDNDSIGGGKCGQGSQPQRPEPTICLWIFQPAQLLPIAH